MRAWRLRGWATRTLVLTVVVLVAGALVTVGSAWADQGHRSGRSSSSHHGHYSTAKNVKHPSADRGKSSTTQRAHSSERRGGADDAGRRTTQRSTSKGSWAAPSKSSKSKSSASNTRATNPKATKPPTVTAGPRTVWGGATSPAPAPAKQEAKPTHRSVPSIGSAAGAITEPARSQLSNPPEAAGAPGHDERDRGTSSADSTTPTTKALAQASGDSGPAANAIGPKPAPVVHSPAVSFGSTCEPSGRRVTATISNRSAGALTATVTTDAKRSTTTIAAGRTGNVTVHLAPGKAVLVTIGGDRVVYLAPSCASPGSAKVSNGPAKAAPAGVASGVSLAFDRSCDVEGDPVSVHVTNAASAVERVVVSGTTREVPAGESVDVPLTGLSTGDVVTVEAGPTRYDYTVPGCPAVAELDGSQDPVLGAGLTGGPGGFDSDLMLILAGLALVASSLGVLVVAAARSARFGTLR